MRLVGVRQAAGYQADLDAVPTFAAVLQHGASHAAQQATVAALSRAELAAARRAELWPGRRQLWQLARTLVHSLLWLVGRRSS